MLNRIVRFLTPKGEEVSEAAPGSLLHEKEKHDDIEYGFDGRKLRMLDELEVAEKDDKDNGEAEDGEDIIYGDDDW